MTHPRHQYPQETAALQAIARSCGLTEQIKWGKPCFTLHDRNIALIQPFKEYIALLFFKGALLQDSETLLHRIGKQMQAPRQLRFRSVNDIERLRPSIQSYLLEAIALERAGATVERSSPAAVPVPEELQARLDRDPALKDAFARLTPGRRKDYLLHIGSAKQSATRAARVDRYAEQILAGKGRND